MEEKQDCMLKIHKRTFGGNAEFPTLPGFVFQTFSI